MVESVKICAVQCSVLFLQTDWIIFVAYITEDHLTRMKHY